MADRRGGGCALLVVGFVLGWVSANLTRPTEYADAPPVAYEAPAPPVRSEPVIAPPPIIERDTVEVEAPELSVSDVETSPEPQESAPQDFAEALDAPLAPPGPSDDEIRTLIIEQSVASYSGSCPCPYNTDRAGRRCGGRSAYSRPGGASPICYPGDVSDSEVQVFRARN